MKFYEFIVKNVFRRRVRSTLTCLGVAIGITAVVSLLGVTRGFKKSLTEAYETHGIDMIVERMGAVESANSSLKEAIGERLKAFPEVASVTPALRDLTTVGEESFGVPVHGWPAGSRLYDNLQLTDGRRIAVEDENQAMLGATLALRLGKKVGDTVEIEPREFQIVGLYQSPSMWENASAVVPLAVLQDMMGRPGKVNEFQLVLKSSAGSRPEAMAALKKKIEALTDEEGQKLGLEAKPTAAMVASNTEIKLAGAMAWITSAIALMIGSVGVLNTMVMSVLERTQEIGILRAIGWRKQRIVRMILLESFVLSLVGAIVGTLVALSLNWALSHSPAVQGYVRAEVSPAVIGLAFLLSLGVGLIGGAYPAYRGASLPPTEALRYE